MSKTFKGVVEQKNIFGGGSRLLYADAGTAKPVKLSEIWNVTTGVASAGWNDFGATDGGLSMTRGCDKTEWEVDQVIGPIDEVITKWNMTIAFAIAEISLENLQIAWEGGAITTDIIETPNERTLEVGAPEVITDRMTAFLVDKRVTGGVEYVRAYIYWKSQFDGSDSDHAYTKGEKSLLPVSLKLLADTTETTARAFGIIIDQVVP